MSSSRDIALAYAARGWWVFPIAPGKKTPLTAHGFKDATTDPAQLTAWWTQYPTAGIGIDCGRSGLVVVDCDVKQGVDGEVAWQVLYEEHDEPKPETPVITTPSGGSHWYFTGTCRSAVAIRPGLDIRGTGGYVVAWQPVEGALAPVPVWLPPLCGASKQKTFAKGSRNVELTSVAGALRRVGVGGEALAKAVTAINATLPAPLPEPEVATISGSVGGYAPAEAPPWVPFDVPMTGKSQPICNADSALCVLEKHPIFAEAIWFDTFSNSVMTTWEKPAPIEWTETDTQRLLVFLQRQIRLTRMAKSSVEDALGVLVATRLRHQVKDWIKTLAWDQTPRIEMFLTTHFGTPDTPYVRAASRNFWLALMARLTHPGCQMDHMLILEGPQDQGKTKALRILGGPWYLSMAESVMQKDFFQSLQGKLIVELAEMESFRGFAEQNRIKQVISTPTDHYRLPYGRRPASYPRQCVFVGTTNEAYYLRDYTGARRFWPIACGNIDIPAVEVHREQLFAEAWAHFKPGVTWWVMPEEAKEEQEARREEDAWETPIHEFLLLKEDLTISELLTEACHVPLGQITRADTLRVAAILRRFGWGKKKIRHGDKLLWRWLAPAREAGEDLQVKDFEA